MVKYENECVGCSSQGLPCLGDACRNRNVPHYYCDNCGEECDPDDLYDDNGSMICEDCLLSQYDKIKTE